MVAKAETQTRRLLDIMAALRDPRTGCPWDREQRFATIAPYTIEEAYEVADAIARGDMPALADELGDLLFQVVYHARLAEEEGAFDFSEVARAVADKMVRRHPHVFGDAAARDAAAQTRAWEDGKRAERASRDERGTLAGIPAALPALARAQKLSTRAARVGFDWPDAARVLDKLDEEAAELRAELPALTSAAPTSADLTAASPTSAEAASPDAARERLQDELGDMLFVCANLARKLGLDAEACLRAANAKFQHRFAAMEERLAAAGRLPEDADLAELEALWQSVKQAQRPG